MAHCYVCVRVCVDARVLLLLLQERRRTMKEQTALKAKAELAKAKADAKLDAALASAAARGRELRGGAPSRAVPAASPSGRVRHFGSRPVTAPGVGVTLPALPSPTPGLSPGAGLSPGGGLMPSSPSTLMLDALGSFAESIGAGSSYIQGRPQTTSAIGGGGGGGSTLASWKAASLGHLANPPLSATRRASRKGDAAGAPVAAALLLSPTDATGGQTFSTAPSPALPSPGAVSLAGGSPKAVAPSPSLATAVITDVYLAPQLLSPMRHLMRPRTVEGSRSVPSHVAGAGVK